MSAHTSPSEAGAYGLGVKSLSQRCPLLFLILSSAFAAFNTSSERATTWPCSTRSISAWSPSPQWGSAMSPHRSGPRSSWWSSWSLWHSLCSPSRWEVKALKFECSASLNSTQINLNKSSGSKNHFVHLHQFFFKRPTALSSPSVCSEVKTKR